VSELATPDNADDEALVDAYELKDGNLRMFCQHCFAWHQHGSGAGHRIAHCLDPDSPYKPGGYVLRLAGPFTRETAQRVERQAAAAERRTTAAGVYVYFFPSDRLDKQSRGIDLWPCKIGHTAKNVKDRVRQQAAAHHERPVLALVVPTDPRAARSLESALHAELAEHRIHGGAGREWFNINPEMVCELVGRLYPGARVEHTSAYWCGLHGTGFN